MAKKVLLLPLAIIFLLQGKTQVHDVSRAYNELFKKADTLFNGSANEQTDSLALNYYSAIINNVSLSPNNALLLYNCHERAGILQQGLSANSQKDLQHFYSALYIYKTYKLPDSLLFRLLLSTGNAHYSSGFFDSSVYYLRWAEKIIEIYPSAGHAEDLYNSLGALYSESGNYKQSITYFTKALEIIRKTRPNYKEADFAMSMNIASALRLSGRFDSAIYLYKKLLKISGASTLVLNSLGRIYLAKKNPDSALYYLRKIKTAEGNYAIAYNNSLALAYMQKGDTATAEKYLLVAKNYFAKHTPNEKNNYYGSTCKYYGDLFLMEHKPAVALQYYHKAIIQFSLKFNDEQVYANPQNFIGDFASYDLFKALLAKAECFKVLNENKQKQTYFESAKNTYQSAFALADYIKKSIDNDEARLFIADNVLAGYRNAVDLVMTEYDKSKNKDLIELALQWVSKSRAASLAISLKENFIKQYAGIPGSLLEREKNIKVTISRLKLQLQEETNSAARDELVSLINTAELKLYEIFNAYRQYPSYYQQKYLPDTLNIQNIQKNILDYKTGIICYFKGNDFLRAFVIKNSSINAYQFSYDSILSGNITSFISSLQASEAVYDETALSTYLYKALIAPLQNSIDDLSSLIIIPDQMLINLPFEALLMPDDNYLIEKYSVTYQYALPFLHLFNSSGPPSNKLAFAPFASGEKTINGFSVLRSSAEEISSYSNNEKIINAKATKKNFLQRVSSASLIHLATHASVNYDEPENSYIAFYPVGKEDSSYKIFAHELYNLLLPKAELVFLSACETGSGKISQSEGSLSLSRAFVYAGCPNIVTSLWKAEDRSTAYISERFYKYINQGYSYAKALQEAKKDLLADAAMSQFHAPQYWSHLIFVGDVQKNNSSNTILIVVVIFLLVSAAVFYGSKKLKKIKTRN